LSLIAYRIKIFFPIDIFQRYLRPVSPTPPGDVIIKQEPDQVPRAQPALIIRQIPKQRADPDTEPIVLREKPPAHLLNPEHYQKKVITVKGKNLPPPPRKVPKTNCINIRQKCFLHYLIFMAKLKVIIERFQQENIKPPPPIILERWLPVSSAPSKRKVIFEKSSSQIDTESSENSKNCETLTTSVITNHKRPVVQIIKPAESHRASFRRTRSSECTERRSRSTSTVSTSTSKTSTSNVSTEKKKECCNHNNSTNKSGSSRSKSTSDLDKRSSSGNNNNNRSINRHIEKLEQIYVSLMSESMSKFDHSIHTIVGKILK
jgi:hypothetical protein